MKNPLIGLVLAVIALLIILTVFDFEKNGKVVVYDCGMSEWHPDIPKEVKEACRKLRLEQQIPPKRNIII